MAMVTSVSSALTPVSARRARTGKPSILPMASRMAVSTAARVTGRSFDSVPASRVAVRSTSRRTSP